MAQFYHGSAQPHLTTDAVETGPRGGSKQAKRGKAFCGFYVTPDRAYAARYAAPTGAVYAVALAADARVLTLDRAGAVERISEAQAAEWLAQGFDAVRGLNCIGTRVEVAILRVGVITAMTAAEPARKAA